MYSVCVMLTSLEGGTHRHALEMTECYSYRCTTLLAEFTRMVVDVKVYQHGEIVRKIILTGAERMNLLENMFSEYKVRLVHFHHFLYMDNDIHKFYFKLSIPIAVTLHDNYTVCPLITMVRGGKFCQEASAEQCSECMNEMKQKADGEYLESFSDIEEWRSTYLDMLFHAKYVFTPSKDHRKRILRYYPELTDKIRVVENPELVVPEKLTVSKKNNSDILTVGIIGTITAIKGRDLILECAELALQKGSKIKFIIFGRMSPMPERLPENIGITGSYKELEVYALIKKKNIDFFWFSTICPETYSYVLTVPIRLEIPVIAADIGAVADRIKQGKWGELYSLSDSPETVLQKLMSFDYDKCRKLGDFTIKNKSFAEFAELYPETELPAVQQERAVPTEVCEHYGSVTDLATTEVRYLWHKRPGLIWKLKLLLGIGKKRLIKKFFNKIGLAVKVK